MSKVLIIEKQAIVAEAFAALIRSHAKIKIINKTRLDRALQQVKQVRPDIVLIEIASQAMTGLNVIYRLLAFSTKIKIIVVTENRNPIVLAQTLKLGISGFVTKNCSAEELLKAIDNAFAGKQYIETSLAEQLATAVVERKSNPFQNLSTREFQILFMLVHGKKFKEIAVSFGVSEKTIASYHSRLLRKVGVSTNAMLVRLLHEYDLIEDKTIVLPSSGTSR